MLNADIERVRRDHEKKKRRPRLLKDRESALKPIREHFGALAPENIANAYVDAYAVKRSEAGVGDRTISIELAYLRAALKKALKAGRITRAPEISLPQAKARTRRRVLSRKELVRLMAAINDKDATPLHVKGFVMLSLHTGQRGIHIRNLRWGHVDYEDGYVYFTRSNPNAAENKQTADMPITGGLREVLLEMQRAARTPYVIEWKDKQVGSLKTAFASLAKRAQLDNFHVHDIRRSFATLGAIADISIENLAHLMNVDEATLRAHYAHGISDKTRRQIERIGANPLALPPSTPAEIVIEDCGTEAERPDKSPENA